MATTWTLAQLRALETAMATGTLEYQEADGTRRRFRSLDEMERLRATMMRALGLAKRNSGRRYATFNKGF